MPDQKDTVLGKLAVERGYVTQEQLDEALANQRKMHDEMGIDQPIAQILVGKGWLTGDQLKELTRAAAHETGAVRIVGGYEVVARLGQGGMGAVYKARKLDTGQFVALKVLPPSLATESLVARFKREAEITRKLESDNIVGCVEFGFDEKRKCHFCALEFIEGEDLRLRIKKTGRLPEKQAIAIARGIAKALEHAFLNGLVHRDVKPANIMVTPEGNAKLLDLGLARPTDRKDVRLTQSGAFVGSAYYASPEQARGRDDIDIRADVYSLGATLYHMVTGKPPFDGESMMTVLQKQISDTVAWPADAAGEVSEGISWVIAKMMAKDPDERYETPGDVVADLDLLAEGAEPAAAGGAPRKSTVAHPRQRRSTRSRQPRRAAGAVRESARRPRAAPEEERSKMPYALVGGTLAGLAVLGIIWAAGRPRRRPDEPSPPAPPVAAAPRPRPEPRAKPVAPPASPAPPVAAPEPKKDLPAEPAEEKVPDDIFVEPPPVVEPVVATVPAGAVREPAAASAERGLLGTYFVGIELRQRVLDRIDPRIVFDWGRQAPAPGLPEDEFSVRWEGFIVPPATGDYELGIRSDDGVRLWVEGEQLLDKWGGGIIKFISPPIPLEGGRPHEVRLEYMEQRVDAKVSLLWRGPGMAEAVPIPSEHLRPPAGRGGPVVAAATADALGRGLVGHWTFDEGKGATARDSSGQGNDGAIKGGAKRTKGKIGGALDLDGSSGQVSVPDSASVSLTGDLTVAAWINARRWPANANVVAKDGNASYRFRISGGGCALWLRIADGIGNEIEHVNCKLDVGTWYHVAATGDLKAGEVAFYVNGSQAGVTQRTSRTTIEDSAGPLVIGASGNEKFNGLIDEVRIYDRALSGDEVKALFEGRMRPVPPPEPEEPEEPERPAWLLADMDPLLMKGDHAGAQAWLAKAAGDDKYAEATDEIAAALRVCKTMETRAGASVKGAEARIGEQVEFRAGRGRRKGVLKEVTPERVILVTKYRISGREFEKPVTVPWREFAPDQVAELARKGGWEPAASDAAIARAYMALGRKDQDAARKALEAAGDHPLAEGVRRRI
ncbi:MAG: protein kinase domain-containing protein, partial [Planctomycetota bacterium]